MKVPDGWKKIYLGDVFSHRQDKGIEGLPTLSVTINDGLVDRSTLERKMETNLCAENHALIRKGDIAYNMMRMWQGAVGVAEKDGLVSPAYVVLRPESQIDSEFAYRWFKSARMLYLLGAYSHGITKDRLRLYYNDFSKIHVPLPPLPEQKAIAEILGTWDKAIEKTERLVNAKQRTLRLYTNRLLFGEKRLNNQSSESISGHFFSYPGDWQLISIGDIAKEVTKRNLNQDRTVLSCSKHEGFVNSLDYFGKQIFSNDTSNYKVIKKDQFGYPANHIEEGSIGLLQHCPEGIVSPIYVVFEVQQDRVNSEYMYKLLKTEIYRHIFEISTSASVDRRGSLRWKEFSKIKVLLPPLEEQKQIAETLNAAQKEIGLLKKIAEKYKTQKRGLMQKLLTGEWRVK